MSHPASFIEDPQRSIYSRIESPYGLMAVALAVLFCLITRIRFRQHESTVRFIPTPSTGDRWVAGHEGTIFIEKPGEAIRNWIIELGLVFRIRAAFWAPDILILSDPVGVAYILQKRIYDYRAQNTAQLFVLVSDGSLGKVLDGLRENRNTSECVVSLALPLRASESIKRMSGEILESTNAVLNELLSLVQAEGGVGLVNAIEWTNRATLNIIGRVAFNHDFEAGNSRAAQVILGARNKSLSKISHFATFLTLLLLRRFTFMNYLPIPALKAQGLVVSTIKAGVAKEIVKRDSVTFSEAQSGVMGNDILSRLLTAVSEKKTSQSELYEQISTFMVSGQETTSHTLSFAILELSRHPKKQMRLREELMSIPGEPTYDDFQVKLPYLDAVLRETLRMYPSLPYMERIATKPDTIPLGTVITLSDGTQVDKIVVHPGQTILIPILSAQRLDSVWTDGEVFRPERWLDPLPPHEKLFCGWSNTLAFSDGPRACIGMKLAMYEFKLILSLLIKRFEIEHCGHNMSLRISSSLQPWVEGEDDKGPQALVTLRLL